MKRSVKLFAIAALAGGLTQPAAAAEYKIGVILPYAPPFGIYAKSMETAMKMALAEHKGKAGGLDIKLFFENDNNKPPEAVAKAKKLISDEKVDLLMGGLTSGLAIPIVPIAVRGKTPLVIINGGADMLTGKRCSPWVIRVSFSNDQIVRDSGPWLFKKGIKKVYAMAADYVGGHDLVKNFRGPFEKAGGKIVGQDFPPFSTKDFGPYLAKARAAKPDAIYVFFPGGMGIQFVRQYDKFGLKGQILLTGPAWTVGPLLAPAQGLSGVGFKGPINYIPQLDNPSNTKFRAAFKAKTKRDPDEVTINGYDAIKMVVQTLDKLGKKPKDGKAMIEALRSITYNGPRGPMRIDPKTNNVIQNIYMVEVVNDGGKPSYKVLDTIANVQDPPNGCKL
ncbi:MAG: ABC transporter substrate-binding protein [Bauldia litoralis]